MIPEFDENGNLPPGIHFCSWSEFKEKFGYNTRRNTLISGIEDGKIGKVLYFQSFRSTDIG